MRKLIFNAVILFLSFSETNAQPKKIPKWVSEKGFWVMESNADDRSWCIVRFYNNDEQLVYSEKIEGKVLDTKKRKIKMKLKEILEQSVARYEQVHITTENKMQLANKL